MPDFPSRAWCEAAKAILNEDPEREAAAVGWKGDLGVVVEPESGKLDGPFTIYVEPDGSRVGKMQFLEDPDDLDEIEPAYVIRAPYSIWKSLLLGTLDPVEAVIKRRVKVAGDVQPLIERARFKGIADRMLSKLETRFVDE